MLPVSVTSVVLPRRACAGVGAAAYLRCGQLRTWHGDGGSEAEGDELRLPIGMAVVKAALVGSVKAVPPAFETVIRLKRDREFVALPSVANICRSGKCRRGSG